VCVVGWRAIWEERESKKNAASRQLGGGGGEGGGKRYDDDDDDGNGGEAEGARVPLTPVTALTEVRRLQQFMNPGSTTSLVLQYIITLFSILCLLTARRLILTCVS